MAWSTRIDAISHSGLSIGLVPMVASLIHSMSPPIHELSSLPASQTSILCTSCSTRHPRIPWLPPCSTRSLTQSLSFSDLSRMNFIDNPSTFFCLVTSSCGEEQKLGYDALPSSGLPPSPDTKSTPWIPRTAPGGMFPFQHGFHPPSSLLLHVYLYLHLLITLPFLRIHTKLTQLLARMLSIGAGLRPFSLTLPT